jgi:hypothetical protein
MEMERDSAAAEAAACVVQSEAAVAAAQHAAPLAGEPAIAVVAFAAVAAVAVAAVAAVAAVVVAAAVAVVMTNLQLELILVHCSEAEFIYRSGPRPTHNSSACRKRIENFSQLDSCHNFQSTFLP